MNKIILTSTLIAALGAGALCGNAFAQSAQDNTAAATTTTTTSTSATTTTAQAGTGTTSDVAMGNKPVPAPGTRNCIRDTGSHVRRQDQPCLPLNGNSYSRDDLLKTGEPDLGRALQQLDPTIHGGG